MESFQLAWKVELCWGAELVKMLFFGLAALIIFGRFVLILRLTKHIRQKVYLWFLDGLGRLLFNFWESFSLFGFFERFQLVPKGLLSFFRSLVARILSLVWLLCVIILNLIIRIFQLIVRILMVLTKFNIVVTLLMKDIIELVLGHHQICRELDVDIHRHVSCFWLAIVRLHHPFFLAERSWSSRMD